ncbi:MAG TPA: MogA/MoaB family molybdenum cofactor biosynthesis protein [Fimbriimonadales bacterium]|nr:MogA/MoaB family molybdenum cofactor biosynthesis protein [Fimbriimonadales bacterium]
MEGLERIRFGVLTISDSRTIETDISGKNIEEILRKNDAKHIERRLVRDEIEEIGNALISLCERCDVIFTTGGTGFAPRDVTPEATLPLLNKRATGLENYLLIRGLEKTRMAPLSRGVCGIRNETLIVNLPGSPNGAQDGVEALLTLIPHIVSQIRGEITSHE